MGLKRKIKVLIVDDSLFFREAIAREISQDPMIDVVATAPDPYVARDKILEYEPDVMTLDVEMPRMNGIDFLRKLMPQYPIPTIVVSAVSEKVFDALQAGAVDFVSKPNTKMGIGMDAHINELLVKIKIASTAKVGARQSLRRGVGSVAVKRENFTPVIAIGASTGGTEAIDTILQALPADMPGIVVVQHMPPVFTNMYAKRLDRICEMDVKEAETGDRIKQGRVLVAPGDRHMRVRKVGSEYIVECKPGEKVSGHCPSVDILFRSIAEQVGANSIGVILTGMGRDGAEGLLAMKRNRAYTLGQDEQSSIVYGMPKVAYDIGAVQEQAPLEIISQKLYNRIFKI